MHLVSTVRFYQLRSLGVESMTLQMQSYKNSLFLFYSDVAKCSCVLFFWELQGFHGPHHGQHKAHPKLPDAHSGARGPRVT